MAFQINTNIPSLQAQEYLRISSDFQNKTINRVTSGLRIVSSGDDAAGLAIANGFRSDQAVLTQGIRNANDGLSTLQIIDGGINNISKLLDRARTLATQSASGTFTGSRTVLNNEFQSLVTEINRQAQAIGLDTGGQFARSLSVFIGGGRTNAGVSEISNGSVSVDLSRSTIDGQSLGLTGVRAASASGTDLSTASPTTSVEAILNDSTNAASQAVAGFTDFYFRGAGFSDDNRIRVSANLSGVTNTSTLAAALNDAITSAGNGTTAAATAFKNANIKAVVVADPQTDGSVKERLGFISSNGAFQVSAGDQLANALLGNFGTGAAGKSLANTFVGGAAVAAGATTFAGTANVIVRVNGGGLTGPVDVTLSVTAATTVAQALTDLSSQVANNAALQAAGITLDTASATSPLVFSSSRGERFEVSVAGDTAGHLGLGSFQLATAAGTSFDYTSITGVAGNFAAGTTQTLEFSIAGGAKQSVTVAAGGAATVAGAVASLNAAFSANSVLQNAGLQASVNGGQIQIASSNGTAFRLNGLTGGTNTLGFSTAGAAFAGNLQSAITSANSETFNIGAGTNDVFSVSVDGGTAISVTLTAGGARTAAQVAADLNGDGAFAAVARATAINGRLYVSAINAGSTLKIETAANDAYTALGFTAGDNSLSDRATVNSGGAYQSQLGTNNDVFSFRQIRNGSDDQTITITAVDASGADHSLSVVLQNDATARSGQTLDQALKAINGALQQSGDPTLRKIVAVKEQNAAGDGEGFRFLSTLPNFRVSIGATGTSTAASEVGAYDGTTGASVLGQGIVEAAGQSEGGSQVDISTQSGAETAVTSLAEAVKTLGNAQATVGLGQNQFSFAVNLAQSQVTNIAAAESRIRDADLAAEAANLTKAQIILQAGIAALAQANSAPQAVLALLRG